VTAYGNLGIMRGPSLVLLAGGASVRFGSDKLAAHVGEHDLLSLVLSRLPAGLPVTVVGPARPLTGARSGSGRRARPRSVTWVREAPPGSGPARAVHAGVVAASAAAPSLPVVVLPADAPDAHLAVDPLLAALDRLPAAAAGVVGVGADGTPQPLHLALTPAGAGVLAADPPAPGSSARALALALGLVPVALPAAATRDVDTPEDLAAYLAGPQ
jgi:molybdopterin-guanine dinucleotide biosynthesis protein A